MRARRADREGRGGMLSTCERRRPPEEREGSDDGDGDGGGCGCCWCSWCWGCWGDGKEEEEDGREPVKRGITRRSQPPF